MNCSLETITPKKSADWLKKNTNNRPLCNEIVQQYARAMKRGEWQLNGETIKFDEKGNLTDGQHRLSSVIVADVSIKCYVVRGVQPIAFDTIDQGRRRTVGQMLARTGESHYNCLACALRFLNAYMRGNSWSVSSSNSLDFTPAIARHLLEKNRGISDSVEFILAHSREHKMSRGYLAALHYLCAKKDPDLAENFFTKLATRENITKKDPVYVLGRRLDDNVEDQKKFRQCVLAAFVIKAWNATREKAEMKFLRIGDDENFPKVK